MSLSKNGHQRHCKSRNDCTNVPVVPGSDGLVTTISDAKQIAKEIGYPVIIKATAVVVEKVYEWLEQRKSLRMAIV